jgi:predicted dehydrogenase
MTKRLRAAVIGGSGFGRYHAQWYAIEGAEAVAYYCTSDTAVEAAEGSMLDLTRQSPRGYADLDLMLKAEHPDIVSVCSPPNTHKAPAIAALRSGAHVLCEKPLIYDSEFSRDETLSCAKEMLQAAQAANRILAVNLQYAAVLDPYLQLYESQNGALGIAETYEFDMESKGNRNGPNLYLSNWIELGAHALTPFLKLHPDATLDETTINATLAETETIAEMAFRHPGGLLTQVRIRVGSCPKSQTPVRRMSFNDFHVDIQSARDETGVFRTILMPDDAHEAIKAEDLMRLSIRQFLQAAQGTGKPLVSGDEALRNMDVFMAVEEILRTLQ